MPESCVVSCPGRCWNEAPKSLTLVSPAADSRMLPGLMSRWMTPCWNAYSSARMHLKMISTTLSSGRGVEDVDDVRVIELAGERRFGQKRLVHHALGLRIGVLVEQEHLDRHLAVGERVARQVHMAGGAAADLAQDRILGELHLRLEGRRAAAARARLRWRHRPGRRRSCRSTAAARLRDRACRGTRSPPAAAPGCGACPRCARR